MFLRILKTKKLPKVFHCDHNAWMRVRTIVSKEVSACPEAARTAQKIPRPYGGDKEITDDG